MRLQPFVDRLKAAGAPKVAGQIEWAGLTQVPRGTSLFVVAGAEAAQPNSLDHVGVTDQEVSIEISVVIAIEAAARIEARIAETLDEQQQLVRRALLGWTHPDATEACAFAGGRLLSTDRQTLAWADRFRTAYHLRIAT